MKLLAILRIKNQILTIEECLSRLSDLVDEIVVLDNGSTDGTFEVYSKYSKISNILRTEQFDEGRDKVMLLEAAKKSNPNWIIWIDGDEIFEKKLTRKVLDAYMKSKYNRITFRMCNFWLDKKNCRYDGPYLLYTLHPQRSMWRNLESSYFVNKKIHNGDIQGIPGPSFISPYRLKHYGFVDAEKMRQKRDLYIKTDPGSNRNYPDLDPDKPFKSFVFREFNSYFFNYIYIVMYKYFCNAIWLFLRIVLKFKKLFS